MNKHNTKMKGKKVLSLLLALVMVLSVASPAFSEMLGVTAKAASKFEAELAFNNLFVFEKWANHTIAGKINPDIKAIGEMTTNIPDGSFTLKNNDVVDEDATNDKEVFNGVTNKASTGYSMPVEGNTAYTLSYKLSATYRTDFEVIVFYYKANGDQVTTRLDSFTPNVSNSENSKVFTTPADAAYIQLRFDNNKPGTTITVKDIAVYKTELRPQNNLFDFSGWASDANTPKPAALYGYAGGTVETNTAEESITITTAAGSAYNTIYTNFTLYPLIPSVLPEENGYYTIDVKPNAAYTVSYNLTDCNLLDFQVWIARYKTKEAGEEYDNCLYYTSFNATQLNGYNSFSFTTNSETDYIQIVFASNHGGNVGLSGTVKDIAICETENLFDLSAWANSSCVNSFYGNGTVTLETTSADGISFATNETVSTSAPFLSGVELGTTVTNCYTMDVDPNTTYSFHYNFTDYNGFSSPVFFQPFVAWVDDSGTTSVWINYETINWGYNQFSFTTPDGTDRIQVVFCIYAPSATCNVRDIVIQKSEFEENTGYPHRKYYPKDSESYGTLPTPSNIPEGQVFAGWYTGENGEGRYIASNSDVHYSSLTVYPKFEPEVTSLRVVSYPKTTYDIGEKFNPTGLALEATVADGSTFTITSGYRYTPEYASTQAGTQNITISYGGATCTLPITVSAGAAGQLTVNGAPVDVTIANNEYTLNNYTDNKEFNRYELAYISDSYVKGTITFGDGKSEDFFLEPSDEGSFASYIDGYITKNDNGTFDNPDDDYLETATRSGIQKIKFTFLDKDFGKFELLSLTTIDVPELSDSMVYKENAEYKVGIDLAFGGVVSYIEDLDDDVRARIYETGGTNPNGSKQYITKVDYENLLADNQVAESEAVNLINTFDRGRYLQQSYYGTDQPPFEMGSYNGEPWSYNPVQGGNIRDKDTGYGNEASKIIDYRRTDKELYIKTRPLDWGKNSKEYEDSYITDSYMEAWYVFEDGMIKTYCRFVDFSGYPSNFTDQELPALYTIEPLNHLVYYGNEKSKDKITSSDKIELKNEDDVEFWGVSTDYNTYHDAQDGIIGEDDEDGYPLDNDRYCTENWAAFTASADDASFGIGVYSPGVTDFTVGTYPQIYNTIDNGDRTYTETMNENYRHAQSVNPAAEDPTSYIAPVDQMTFESYKPYEYSYYVTTGTAAKIRNDFNSIADKDAQAEKDKTRVAVPETVYLNPADNKVGEIYVNNIMDANNYYNVITEAKAEADMYFGLRVKNAKSFEVNVTNITDSTNDIAWVDKNGNGEGTEIDISTGMYTAEYGGSLSLTSGLNHGETATAKWDILVYLKDGTTESYTAYTVLYAPERTVGAVAESHTNENSLNEVSSWITGANGVDHSKRSPLGGFHGDVHDSGYFKQDPLYSDIQTTGGESHNSHDYINTDHPSYAQNPDNGDDYSENAYVLQTATDENDGSRAQSYLGLLTVDGSRYTNTNQIPNFRIGYDALRHGTNDKDSYNSYATYYTLGSDESFITTEDEKLNEKPSGFTTYTSYSRPEALSPKRDTVVPAYNVSEINDMYIHAIAQAESYQYGVLYNWRNYATAGTSVLCSVTDKGELRDSVLDGYTKDKADYSETAYNKFATELEEAAEVLGDPSATKEEIDNAKKELNEAKERLTNPYFALKYDNLFSALEFSQNVGSMTMVQARSTVEYDMENSSIIINSLGTQGTDIYTAHGTEYPYYNVVLDHSKEYIFEYDVKSDEGSQVLLFFYDENGAGVSVTDRSIQVDSSAPNKVDETDTHFASYTDAADSHIVMRFKTPDNVAKVAFRFGNTNSINNESTFSNIRLVEASKYYADVEYPETEDVFKENVSYGVLPTLNRTGYTFAGWSDVNDIGITEATIATEHRTIYSQWNEHTYTITFNANGGSGSIEQIKDVPYSRTVTLPESGFTLNGFKLIGWSTKSGTNSVEYALGEKVSGLAPENKGAVTLYAVWAKSEVNVTFDNLFDTSQVIDSLDNEFVDVTDKTYTGFTLKAVSESKGNDCYPEWTYDIPVKPNTTYTFTADVEHTDGNPNNDTGYEIFVGVKDGNKSLDTDEVLGENCNPEGSYFKTINKSTFTFTTSSDSAYVSLRFDVNDYQSVMTVENIRLWEADGTTVSPVNKVVGNGNQYGELADATRTGYTFAGWYDNQAYTGNPITSTTKMESTSTVNLYSKWTPNQYVINFSANGPDVATPDTDNKYYTDSITVPGELEWEHGTFVGWSLDATIDPYVTEGIYYEGDSIPVSEAYKYVFINENGEEEIQLHAVWQLKESVVVGDTVIVDFGKPVIISPYQMNDSGVFLYHAGNMCESYNVVFADGTKEYNGSYGTFKVNENGYTINYTPTSVMQGEETVEITAILVYETTNTEKEFKSTITVAPATNVLYEDGFMTSGALAANYTGVAWTEISGDAYDAKLYDKDTSLYNDQNLIDETPEEVYGYNSKYKDSIGFSDGSYRRVILTADDSSTKTVKENMSDVATFTFTGRGFDLIAACGVNTGIQVVKIKNTKGEIVDSFIIDTYLSDTSIMTDSVDKDKNGNPIKLLHQVPILSYRTTYQTVDGVKQEVDLPYGTYTVEVNAAYLSMAQALKYTGSVPTYFSSVPVVTENGVEVVTNTAVASSSLIKELEEMGIGDMGDNVELLWMDDNSVLNGGTGATEVATSTTKNGVLSGFAQQYFGDTGTTVSALANYLDGFRIYNPLKGGGGDPIYIESEQNASYYNIVQQLEMDSTKSNLAYIESGNLTFGPTTDAEGNEIFIDFDAYNNQGGPKAEIYLGAGQGIAFKFSANHVNSPANVMLGMRAVTGTPDAYVEIANNKDTKPITSSTEMYYEVATAVNVTQEGVTVIVINKGDGILAVNNIKLVNGNLQDNGENTPVTGSSPLIGGASGVPVTRPSVVPGATDNTVESDAPEANLPDNSAADTNTPEADVNTQTGAGDNGEDAVTNTDVPSGVASIFSFIEMLLEFIGSLVKSLGF